LNADDSRIAACEHRCIQVNAFEWLKGASGDEFDLIVIDPPSLAKKRAERAGAMKAYRQLTAAGIRRLAGGGVLVMASCSAHVTSAEFFELVLKAARASGRPFREIGRATHAADHPATFPEAEYLKCIRLRMD